MNDAPEPAGGAAEGPPPRVCVVMLSYNSGRFVAGCLEAIGRSRGVELEVIVVDNASREGDVTVAAAEAHPSKPRVIRSEENLGCAGGNDLGWRSGSAPYVAFINPDCRVMADTLAQLVAPLVRDDSVGCTGARLRYPNSRTIQHAGGILHPNAMAEHIGLNKPDAPEYAEEREVDYVTGALMAFRRADLEAVGGFDPEFFPAYYEETDLMDRVRRRLGKRVLYVGGALAYHWESPDGGRQSPWLVRTSYRGRMLFLVKNRSVWELLTEALPFEWRWFFGPFARHYRLRVLRSYGAGLVFAARCLLRRRRRPRSMP